MSIPCGVCTKVQKNGNLRRNQGRYRENIETIMQAERNRDNRSRIVSRPCTYADKHTTKIQCVYLKGKSSLMIFDRHANLKYKYGNRHFWARGYFVDTVGRNKKQIQEYIRNQLTEDKIADQIELKEFVDPFTGSVNKQAKKITPLGVA